MELFLTFAMMALFFLAWKTIGWRFDRVENLLTHTRMRLEEVEYELAAAGDESWVQVKEGELLKSTDDAAAWDIYAAEDRVLFSGQSAGIKTGLVTEMADCVFGLILDRSGLARNKRVTRRAGVIDSKYPDEWEVILVNEGPTAFEVKKGDRIAQVIFFNKAKVVVKGDGVTVSTDKREGGFGSTGLATVEEDKLVNSIGQI